MFFFGLITKNNTKYQLLTKNNMNFRNNKFMYKLSAYLPKTIRTLQFIKNNMNY